MNTQYEDELRIAERSAEWLNIFERAPQGGVSPTQRAEFMAWLEESPRHVRGFLAMQAWDLEAGEIDPQRQIDVAALLLQARENVVQLPDSQPASAIRAYATPPSFPINESDPGGVAEPRPAPRAHHHRESQPARHRWYRASLIAAALATVAVLSWQLYSEQQYTTAIGEQRSVELTDGSKMDLGTGSAVRVEFSAQTREVQLLNGEATFKVEHEAARPFRVRAGNVIIQAVGTQFNVNRRPMATTVAVLEGRVRIADTLLVAGEAARVDLDGRVTKREDIVANAASAWSQRRLVFRDDTLVDIAAEFNRYNRNPQIIVQGDAARGKRYGGIFDADDPQSIVRFVDKDPDLSVQKDSNRIVIRSTPR